MFNRKKTEKKRRTHLRQCLREKKTCSCTKALAAGLGYVR